MKIFLTGKPGIGKSTVLMKAVELLREKGVKVGGMISSEIRVGGIREGFEITDLMSGVKGILAHIHQKEGPKISRYRVNLKNLVEVGVKAIYNSLRDSDLIVIDEVGPMELFSNEFKEAVKASLESDKPILGSIHYRFQNPFINFIKSRSDVRIIEVTHDNRSYLGRKIAEELLKSMQKS